MQRLLRSRDRLFGHIARANGSKDHQRALRAAINRLPADWQRAQEVNLGGPGFVPSNSTFKHATWTSTWRGSGQRIAQNGVNLWRRLCSSKGVPPSPFTSFLPYFSFSQIQLGVWESAHQRGLKRSSSRL